MIQRRSFIQGLIASVCGGELILKATDADVRAFSIGDKALLHAVETERTPFEEAWEKENQRQGIRPHHRLKTLDTAVVAEQAVCTIAFPDGTKFSFVVGDIFVPGAERNLEQVSLLGDNSESYVAGVLRRRQITMTPIGPIRIDS